MPHAPHAVYVEMLMLRRHCAITPQRRADADDVMITLPAPAFSQLLCDAIAAYFAPYADAADTRFH